MISQILFLIIFYFLTKFVAELMEGIFTILSEACMSYIHVIFSYQIFAMLNYYNKKILQYLFKTGNWKTTRISCETCPKLILKTPERHQ